MLPTIGFLVARFLEPGRHQLELDVYVLALGTIGVLVAVAALAAIAPREEESLLEEALTPDPPQVPGLPELDRLARELTLAADRDFDLHYRLRPILREIAQARLERRGLALDIPSQRADDLLGEELIGITSAERVAPTDRLAKGLGLQELDRLVARLERI